MSIFFDVFETFFCFHQKKTEMALSTAEIVGIAVGSTVLFVLFAYLIYYWMVKRRGKKGKKRVDRYVAGITPTVPLTTDTF